MGQTMPLVALHKNKEWWAYCPEIPGVYGVGETASEAEKDLEQAFKLHLMARGDLQAEPDPPATD